MHLLVLSALSLVLAAPVDPSSAKLLAPVIKPTSRVAPDFAYRSLDGRIHHLSELRDKVVIINFWGTWCPGCIEELPTFQLLFDRYRNDPKVVFLFISQNDTADKVERFAKKSGLSIPFYYLGTDPTPEVFSASAWPATYFIAPNGKVVGSYLGGGDWFKPFVSTYIDHLKTSK